MKHYQLFKLRAVLLLFALFCSVSSVWAEKHYVVGDSGPMWEYDESTKTLTISGEGHVGYTGPTPWGSLEIVNVIIESGITSIGGYMFSEHADLVSVSIPNTVTTIGAGAFNHCTSLPSIYLPDNIEDIGEFAFSGCMNLASANIPANLKIINTQLFSGCKLQSITIPEGVTEIKYYAFWGCDLTSVTIPASVIEIGANPFANCEYLTSITVNSGNTYYDSRDNCNAIIEKSKNKLISGCSTTVIPNGVTIIGSSAWFGMNQLSSITIPEGVESIMGEAFRYCSNLKSVVFPSTLRSICSLAFSNCAAISDILCYATPNGFIWEFSTLNDPAFKPNKGTICHVNNKDAWETAFPNVNVTFSEGIPHFISGDSGLMWEYDDTSKEIVISGEGDIPSFETTDSPWKNADIETITIAEGVTSIGDYAFKNTSVEAVTISSTVATIGAHAFESCTSLASINIPEGVATTREYAFKDCSSLETVTLPNSLTSIETGAFVGCVATEDVYCYANPANLTWTDSNTGFKDSKATVFHVENATAWVDAYPESNVTYVQDLADDWTDKQYISGNSGPMWQYSATLKTLKFSGNGPIPSLSEEDRPWYNLRTDIEAVIILEGITSIGSYTFDWFNQMTSVTIPNTVTSIGEYAFSGCTALPSIIIPHNVTSISRSLFQECEALTSVSLPDNITTIGDLAFSGCKSLTSINIPEKVTSIGLEAFAWCTSLESVTIPEGVTSIQKSTFSLCTKLTSINIPNTVTSIEERAFYGCSKLSSINIPSSVISIGKATFSGCYTLTSLILPNSISSIEDETFKDCSNLSFVQIPDGVNTIGKNAFEWCQSLKALSIPRNITKIGENAFYKAYRVTDMYFDENTNPNNLVWDCSGTDEYGGAVKTICHVKDKEEWESRFSNVNVVFADDIMNIKMLSTTITGTNIALYADADIKASLTGELCIPSYYISGSEIYTVSSLTDNAFKDCTNLTSITIPGTINNISSYSFAGCTSLKSVNIQKNVKHIGDYAFSGCTALESVSIPSTIISINTYSFQNCSQLKSVYFPKTITNIAGYAFEGCSSVTDVYFDNDLKPNNVTWSNNNIGFKVSKATIAHVKTKSSWTSKFPNANVDFRDDKETIDKLTCESNESEDNALIITVDENKKSTLSGELIIPQSISRDGSSGCVTGIGEDAFSGCTGLTSIVIPETVTSVGSDAFANCTGLTSFSLPSNVTSIGSGAFAGCNQLEAIVIPNNVSEISASTFSDCSSLESIGLPENLTSIGESAFSGCTGISSVSIPSGVTSIGQSAFAGCTSLTSATLPSGLTSISQSAFTGCSSLASVSIPNTITSIGKEAFKGTGLTTVEIPYNVEAVGESSFEGCSGLVSVELPTNLAIIAKNTFLNCTNMTTVNIPVATTEIKDGAFKNCQKLVAVSLPSGLVELGMGAFEASGLESITLPPGVTAIAASAFKSCQSLVSATLYSPTVATVSDDSFSDNHQDLKIKVPNDLLDAYRGGISNVKRKNRSASWSSYSSKIYPITLDLNADPEKSTDKWCTYYNDLANMTVPSGTTIYKAQLDQVNNKVVLTEVEGSVVAKGNAVMLKSSDANIALSSATTSDLGTYSDNDLKGGDVTSGYIAYTLAGINGIMGFYRFTGNSLDPNKAHLEVANSNPNSAPQLIPFDNGTTEIMLNTVKTAEDKGEWYSLDGRLIQGKPTQKGIYVKKGKKYVVK